MKSKNLSIFIIFLFIFSLDCFLCRVVEKQSLSEEDVITTIKEDDESALRDALLILWKFGGIIYIDTPVINVKKQETLSIKGSFQGGIIGIKQENGEYPRLNFKEQRDTVTYLYMPGLSLDGSNKLIQYLIIENAGTVGISINGQKNTIDHVITRYNGHSGIYLLPKSDSNNLNHCYSYRNFHFSENRLTADGFTVENGGINNVFNYCFAWENSQNGFGYSYWDGQSINGPITYSHSASWNNGNINVFSGKYDFDNGKKLDKNLWTIEQIMKSDENFEKNYNNKKFNLEDATINSKPAIEYFIQYDENNDANGFNLGNDKNDQSTTNVRTLDYCVAFANKLKGFNSNQSKNFNGFFTNCVGFNNNINYDLPYSFTKWSNNWSWGSEVDDQIDYDLETKIPSDIKSEKKKFNSIVTQIIKAVSANTFPENINFDKTIKSLKE